MEMAKLSLTFHVRGMVKLSGGNPLFGGKAELPLIWVIELWAI